MQGRTRSCVLRGGPIFLNLVYRNCMSICPTKYTIQLIVLKDEQMIVDMVFYECLINAGKESGHQIGRRLHRWEICTQVSPLSARTQSRFSRAGIRKRWTLMSIVQKRPLCTDLELYDLPAATLPVNTVVWRSLVSPKIDVYRSIHPGYVIHPGLFSPTVMAAPYVRSALDSF